MHVPSGGPASIGLMRKPHPSSTPRVQNAVQTPGADVPPSGIASMARHKPPAHSVLERVSALAVQPAPIDLPAIGASTHSPDAGSHLRVPQSESVTHSGMHAKV